MNITAREFTSAAEMKAAAVAVRRRLLSPAVRPKPPQIQPVPKIATQKHIERAGWMMQPTTFDAHVMASLPILGMIKRGEIEVVSHSRRSISQIVGSFLLRCPRFSSNDVKSQKRHCETVMIRHIAMYLVHVERPDISYPAIGRWFGGRDHTTVMFAVKKIKKLLETKTLDDLIGAAK